MIHVPCATNGRGFTVVLVAAVLLALSPDAGGADLTATRTDRGVTIKIGDALFTEYLIASGAKPVLWPILGPTNKPMTRAYPMDKASKEAKDHIHHRSLWFTHGNVNGVDFWSEAPGHGTIKHREFETIAGGRQATVVSRNDWSGPDDKRVCQDRRRLTFASDGDSRWIDFDITLTASDGPITFGDTKEGTFGLRVAGPMAVDSKHGGRIVNSAGQVNAEAWAKRAPWVDYQGPVDGQTLGIAIFNHPTSFRFPTYWHVRTYGLFAANPFGVHDFGGKSDGSYVLPAGQSVTFCYRVLFHKGDEKQANVAAAYEEYARTGK
jgi:hypothetical protein